MNFGRYAGIFRIILLTLVILTVLNFSVINSYSSDSKTNALVSSIFLSSWAVPPNTQGYGIINIRIFYATSTLQANLFALKLVISLPEGVYNSSGGSYIINYFPITYPTYISYNFSVIINSSVSPGSNLNFQATLIWFLSSYNGSVLQQVTPINFTLPYLGDIGVKVISNTSFLHLGLNHVAISIVNEGKSPIKNVCLYVDGQTIYIPTILSQYTYNLSIFILPHNQFQYKLPISLTYYTPYYTFEHYNTTLDFVILYNTTSPVLLDYYNLLSPNPYYLEPGPNYLVLYLNNSLGMTFNSSWLLISKDNTTLYSFFIKNWSSGNVIKIFLPINITSFTTNLVRLNLILLTNNQTTYNLTSFSIPVADIPRLSFNIILENSSTYLQVRNNLNITVNNVSITIKELNSNVEYNYTLSELGANSSILFKLNNTINQSKEYLVYAKFRAFNFIIIESNFININITNLIVTKYSSIANLTITNYSVYFSNNPYVNNQNMIYLLIQIKNIGKEPAVGSYLILHSNSSTVYISPFLIQLGTIKPGEIVFESITIYIGNSVPKTLDIYSELVYNNSINYVEQNYTLQIPVYTLYYHYNYPLYLVMLVFGYTIYGIPLIFIVVVIILAIVILFPRIKK